jgi:DNA-binding CsgD family transcriptional regulator/tetratricopeptide (TPR) repeat protein
VGNTVRAGAAMTELSRTYWRLCRGADSEAMARAALDTLEPLGRTPELARAYVLVAALRCGQHDVDGTFDAARRAQQLALELHLPAVQASALNFEGEAVFLCGGDGVSVLGRALQIALDAGAVEDAGRSYANLHELLMRTRRLAESIRCFEEGVAYCDEHDIGTYATCLRGWHANVLELLGRWDEASALCTATLASVSSPVNRLTSLAALGRILARRGDPSAWRYLDEAAASAGALGERDWIVFAGLARAEARWLAGDQQAARSELDAIESVAQGRDEWGSGSFAVWRRRTGSRFEPPRERIAAPFALQLDGDHHAAAQALDRLGCTFEAALAMFDVGTEDALRDALRRFEALGATAAVEVTRRTMRAQGIKSIPVGPRSATREHPLGLTRRERDVLDLLCAGRTNSEISTQLFISARTVDHHVSAVLAKLGTPTRAAAAAEAARLGLVAVGEK